MGHKEQENQQNVEYYQNQIDTLKGELYKNKDETRRSSIFVEKEQGKLQEDIKHKDELIQILKI